MTGENNVAGTTGNSDKSRGSGKLLLLIGAVVIIVGLIAGGFIFLRKTEKKEEPVTVGSIDREKIFETKLFSEANAKLEKELKDLQESIKKETANLDEKKPEDLTKLKDAQTRYYMQKRAKEEEIIKPAFDQTRKVISNIALAKGLTVVLDKRIVVCGSQDITDDVFKKLESGEKIEAPSDSEIDKLNAKSKIGYFNQYVVANLPDFRKAQDELVAYRGKLQAEFEKVIAEKKLNEEDQAKLKMVLLEKDQKFRDDLQAPIIRKVNRTVEKVAKDKKLSLIVDSENIMFGGVNVTDEVANELSGK